MSAVDTARPMAAYVEDYFSDDQEGTLRPASQANVAAKRKSNSSNVEREPPVEVRSDSGYSSRTAATTSSADSAQSMKSGTSSAAAAAAPKPARKQSSASGSNNSSKTSTRSPAKPQPPSRTTSTRGRNPVEKKVAICAEPNCKECLRNRSASVRERESGSTTTARASVRTTPAASPATSRAPSQYPQPSSAGQSQVRPRPRANSTSRARPQSYHAGMSGVQYGSGPTEATRPPPSRSAYMNTAAAHHAPVPAVHVQMPTPQPTPGFPPPGFHNSLVPAMQHLTLDTRRPAMTHRQTDSASIYSARKPTKVYNDQPSPASFESISTPTLANSSQMQVSRAIVSARRPGAPPPEPEPEYSEESTTTEESEEDEEDGYDDEDTRRMPPPRRPSMRKPNSSYSPAYNNPSYSQRMLQGGSPVDEGYLDEMYRPTSRAATSYTSLDRRPSLTSSGGRTKATSYSNSSGSGRMVTVEAGSNHRRRQSYMGHENLAQLDAQRRAPAFDEYAYDDPPAQPLRRRGVTDIDGNRRDAEMYMRSTEAIARAQQAPLTESALKRASRGSDTPSGRSIPVTASSRGDRSSRISTSASQTQIAGAEGVKLKIDTSAGFNFAIDGDMEGRTINMVQRPGEGMAELVIGSKRETSYYSQKGSKLGSRMSATEDSRSSRRTDDSRTVKRSSRKMTRDKDDMFF
ncbi:hypothetical protein K402DRAFT_419096 [Aulographum hederae CBS 113979]|uniref:Uncharacterized protein n=1 Tax=Aulographum hederae CBS 113979 TaxID=1176131 RepID=A0A6G1H6Q6_9PEZI|nr:hypothetical protein K402DRAFT_419096 [Aulographum hederae CBS 113979]